MEYHSFLLLIKKMLKCFVILFPSLYGVIFFLTKICNFEGLTEKQTSFRLLTEYHSFLSKTSSKNVVVIRTAIFPSPYGVIFTLTLRDKILMMYVYKFPSPCGVIFILIKM